MDALVALLAFVVALLAVLVVGLLRSHAEVLRALHDGGIRLDPDRPADRAVRASSTAPDIRTQDGVPTPREGGDRRAADLMGTTPAGATKTISVRGDSRTLLAFLTTGCTTCAGFWEAIGHGVELPPATRLVVVTKGEEHESPAEVERLATPATTVIMSSSAWDTYSVPVAPYFVLVDGRSGLVAGEGAAATWDRVLRLLGNALADDARPASTTSRRDLWAGRDRRDRIDRELRQAGLVPGDPRLHHEPDTTEADAD